LKRGSAQPRALLVATDPSQPGGSNCVAAWMLQALQDDGWQITVMVAGNLDCGQLNAHFGTRLSQAGMRLRRLPFPLSHLHRIDPDPFSIQRKALLMRWSQRVAADYDVVLCSDDEMDFGCPGLQYTHYPYLARHMDALREFENLGSLSRLAGLLRGRVRPWMMSSGFTLSRVLRNRMLTNSHWTAEKIRADYAVVAHVLYPPVRWAGPRRDWSARGDSFVVLGRLSPEKRIDELARVIGAVRERGFAVELDIVGDVDVVAGEAWVRGLRSRLASLGDWARLHVAVDRARLEDIVSRARYGLHGMQDEHFGIAPAEMVRAGCIVFVPDNGGPVEIIGEHPGLRYRSDEEAVEKICAMLASEAAQGEARQHLARRAEQFSEEHFMQGLRMQLAEFLASKSPEAGPSMPESAR
jgi:glycosyltransferase involved in cell wall biosynthesis